MINDIASLVQLVKKYKDSRVFITFHSFGDTDAVSSAFMLSSYFKNASIGTPDTITNNARRMLKKNGYNPDVPSAFDSRADLVILTDVNNFEGCGKFERNLKDTTAKILIIDHHAKSDSNENRANVSAFDDEGHNSAASIVTDLMEALGRQPNEREARMLLMGIISDSAEFKNSTPKTFAQIGKLLQIGKTDYPSIIEQMFVPPDARERERATLELFNSKVMTKKGLLFIYGDVDGPANVAADNAIRIGADVSFFKSESRREVSISARLRPPLDKRYGIHVGKIMKELSPMIDGTGGGHPCAGGAYGPNKPGGPEFMGAFIDRIIRALK